jgi:hypothetical protein
MGFVGEHHLQDRYILNDRRRDGSDEEENRGGQEEEGTNMVDNSRAVPHLAGVVFGHVLSGVVLLEDC